MRWLSLVAIIVVLFVTSCAAFEDPSQRATENAENTAFARTVSAVDVQLETMAVLQQTADGVEQLEAQMAQLQNDRDRLATQVANGGQFNSGPVPTTNNSDPFFTQQPSPIPAPQQTQAVGGGVPAGPQPTQAVPGNQQFIGAVTSTAIDQSTFCALSPTDTFSTQAEVIYFVVTAVDLNPGINFTLRLMQGETTLDTDPTFWTSDAFYEQTCIYYGMDSQNFEFMTGTYTAELLANNEVVQQAEFTLQ
ncbi:MAG: hypothetical protein L0154_18495 [Chloroflexi bacterium]|nr:hypothetical protein [Chloroflexota bacterium]